MRCHNGHVMREDVLDYKWKNERLGALTIEDAVIFYCDQCEVEVIPFKTACRMDDKEKEILQEWLWSSCSLVDDFNQKFITPTETAVMLGLSGRQAIHKNIAYKGLIYYVNLKGRIYFFKESVEQFKKTGDGRLIIEKLDGVYCMSNLKEHSLIPFVGSYYKANATTDERLKEN